MLGGFFALLSAATFGLNNAVARRGVLTGSVGQAMAITVPLGLLMFGAMLFVLDGMDLLVALPLRSHLLLLSAGVLHFVIGRYCIYRSAKAIGGALAAPVQQLGLLLTLVLAVTLLREVITVTKLVGIALVMAAPALLFADARSNRGGTDTKSGKDSPFVPDYKQGYTFASIAAVAAGCSPIMVRLAMPEDAGLATGIAAGLVSYLAATVVVLTIFILPGRLADLRAIERGNAALFFTSGILVNCSQIFRYMALAIAPVSVVTPIQRTTIVFRLIAGRAINPQHEILSGRVVVSTFLSLLGAVLLTVSVEGLPGVLGLSGWPARLLSWQWS